MRSFLFFCGSLAFCLSSCSPKSIYYFPNSRLYREPRNAGLEYELVQFSSLNGKKLYGLYFRTRPPAKGVIVHFHGNFGNVSNHFHLSAFLLKYGFDVFIFDYQGFGGSEGRPTPKNTVEDGQAAVRYVRSVAPQIPVGIFGQSVGAAIAAVTAEKEPDVKAVVLESGFTTYRAILKDVMRRSFLTYPFASFVPRMIARRKQDQIDSIANIAPRPLLLIHGTRDKTIPFSMSEALFEKAREPKRFLKVEGADHLQCRAVLGPKYEEEIAGFFTAAFERSSTNNKTGKAEIPESNLPSRK